VSDPRQPASPTPEPQRRRLAQWPVSLVLLGVLAGLTTVAFGHFKRGAVVVGVSVLIGAVLRLALRERDAGLLAVRSRTLDVLTLGALGLALTVLAVVVPPPR